MLKLLTRVKCCIRLRVELGYASFSASFSTKPKFTAILDQEVEEKFKEGERHRLHHGRRVLPCVYLPFKLESSALKVLAGHLNSQFRNDAEDMFGKIFRYQLPKEPSEIRERIRMIMFDHLQREGIDLDALTEEEKEKQLEDIKSLVQQKINDFLANYQQLDFTNQRNCLLYLAARLAPNFAALSAVFNEIKKDDPDFKPTTLFDFGSGLGTTVWAANEVWPKSINEFFCVDISSEMNDLSRLLLQQGKENKKMICDGVFYRQFLPASHNIKYDVVVSAFSLLDLPDARNRIHVIENLWHKTQDMLVIIEHGSRAGFKAVLEARNLVLQLSGHKVTSVFDKSLLKEVAVKGVSEGGHVLAPCPHDLTCPRQSSPTSMSCNFEIKYFPLNYNQKNLIAQKEHYSYVILRKGPKPEYEFKSWPRIILPVLRRHNHVRCRMCCADGKFSEVVFTKRKHVGHTYKCAAISRWGDLFPAKIYPII